LPGASFTRCHEECLDELVAICQEAGLETRREPAHLFSREVPAEALVPVAGRAPAIIPDAAIVASLPRGLAAAGQRPERRREPERSHLVDVKTIHRGARDYREARGTRDQSGAVEARAQRVHTDYVRHARRMDAHHYPPGHPRHGNPGPIHQLLLSHGRVRGAVFGAYGEWSWDVEWLLEEAASRAAQTSWARMGYRRATEARALILQWYRRRMGITVVRAMARHRWRHSQYVGLTRVQLEHSRRRADREHQRQAREQAERRSEEVVRMAQEHYFPWRPEW
jgi:hypothetical protein